MKKNKEYIKRVLAFMLCFVMLSGVSPLNALAEIDFSRLNISLPSFRLPEFNFFGTKASADEDEPVYSGNCGLDSDEDGEPENNLTWQYDSDSKTLFINGVGEMQNYSELWSAPWYIYKDDIKSVKISETVTTIGDYAFYDFTALTDMYIPYGVQAIGEYSFGRSFDPYDDSNFEHTLTDESVGNSVKFVDVCIKMQGLRRVFVCSDANIADTAFGNCFSLEEMFFRKNSTNYDNSFNNQKYTEFCNVYLSRKMINVWEYYFSLTGSEKQMFGNMLQYLGINQNTYDNIYTTSTANLVSFLSNIYTPRFQPKDYWREYTIPIYTGCPMNDNGYTAWVVKDGILYIIGSGVCGDGTNPVIDTQTVTVNGWSSIDTISFSDEITAIANNAFSNLNNIKYLKSPGGVQSIGKNAFGNPTGLFNNHGSMGFVVNNIPYHYEQFNYESQYYIPYYDNSVWEEENPKWIIKGYWFIRASSYTGYQFFGDTSLIADGAFENCSGLDTLKIPSSVKYIGKEAFAVCENLETVYYPGSDVDWNNIVIENGNEPLLAAQRIRPGFGVTVQTNVGTCSGICEWITDETVSMTISAEEPHPDRMTITGVDYSNCGIDDIEEKITVLKINAPVEGINTGAFRNLTNLESITLPESLRSINADAFDGTAYYNNKENWENGVLYIGDCLIKADRGIEGSYTAKEGSRLIADGAFYGCTNLTGITVPDSVEIIGKEAFYGSIRLADITLPGTLKNISENAFTDTAYYNNGANWTVTNVLFRELYIGGNLIDVERYQSTRDYYPVRIDAACVADMAFARIVNNNFDIYVLNENTVFSDKAFYRTDGSFFTNSPESKVYYYGTRYDWNNSNSRIQPGSSWQFIYEGGYFDYTSGADGLTINGMGPQVRVLKIPDELNGIPVKGIAYQAFKDRPEIDSLYICGNIKFEMNVFFGYKTFADCINISYIYFDKDFSENGITIGSRHPFYNVGKSTDGVILEFGENVTTVKKIAFNPLGGAFKIKKLIIPANVETIEENAFKFTGTTAGPIGGGYDYKFGWTDCIPANAFCDMSSLQKITLPESVTTIGDSAFYDCTNLESINIPGSLTSIGYNAFSSHSIFSISLSKLKTVNYFGTIKDWCNISFANQTSNPVFSSGKLLLSGVEVTEIKETDINGVTEIKPYAFCGMTGLTNVNLPDTVTSIGDSAFYKCSALTNVTLPDTVMSIGNSAYYGCINLSVDFTVPKNVTSIGVNAFYDVFNVKYEGTAQGAPWGAKSVNGVVRTYEGTDGKKYKLVFAPTTDKESSKSVLLGCSADATGTVTVPGSVSYVGDRAFANCSRIEKIIYNASEPDYGKNVYVGCSAVIEYTTTEVLAKDVIFGDEGTRLIFCSKSRKGNYTVPEDVRIIEENAFYNCDKLGSITLPGSVVSIGAHAFEGTSTYTAAKANPITVDDKDGNGTFTLVYIGGCLIEATWVQKEAEQEEPEDETGEEEPKEVTAICVLPENTTCIAANAFSGCPELTEVVFNQTLKGISYNAFNGCANLKTIAAADGICIEYVGKDAFSGTAYYNNRNNWQNGILYIGSCLVKANSSVSRSYTVDEGTTCIADSALEGCKDITTVNVPEGVTRIGNRAFATCAHLTSVELPEGLKVIENEAFEDCTALTSAELPATLTRLGGRAFLGCVALESITVTGNTENPVFVSSDGVLFRNKTTDENKTEIHLVVYPPAKTDADYEIPADKADVFDNFAFAYCNNLDSVTFHGVSYKTVAFYECSAKRISDNLKGGIELSEDGTMLMQVTVDALDENGSFKVPDGVIAISGAAFSSVKAQLRGVDLNGALIINDDAFNGCVNLESIIGSESAVHIGANAFNGCEKLEGIDLSGAETICSGAFSGCSKLDGTNVIISKKAVFAVDSFDFEPDSNLKIDTYSNKTVSNKPLPESGELTIDYGSEVTLDTLTEITGEIVWMNARTGDVITGGRTATVTVDDDIDIQAVIMEDSEILVQSAPVKIKVDNIPFKIEIPEEYKLDENIIGCKFCTTLGLNLPDYLEGGEVTWHKSADGESFEVFDINKPVIEDMTVRASVKSGGRTYQSQKIRVEVAPPKIGYYNSGAESEKIKEKTVTLKVSLTENGIEIPNEILSKLSFEWYKDGKKDGEGIERVFKNIKESFKVTVKVMYKGVEIGSYDYTVNVEEQVVVTEDAEIKIKTNGKTEKTVDYKSSVTFTAETANSPQGAKIQWYLNDRPVSGANSKEFKVETLTADCKVQAKILGKDGKPVCVSKVQSVKVKTDFFSKLIALFRQIFRLLPNVRWENVK